MLLCFILVYSQISEEQKKRLCQQTQTFIFIDWTGLTEAPPLLFGSGQEDLIQF